MLPRCCRSRLQRRCSCAVPAPRRLRLACRAQSHHPQHSKQRLVFLGTPEVAATALRTIHHASQQQGAAFEVAAVVSQPGKPRGRGNKSTPLPSPVEQAARDLGLPDGAILCPKTAKEEVFLATLRALAPDLCITAAYGNMLPQRFLDIPRLGTLNIHPSLLPRYRGAAPVQRALQDGAAESGVSVAYTVLKCDAGPVLAQERVAVDPDIQAPDLLALLFDRGSRLLVEQLPAVLDGRGPDAATPQDEGQALHAAKITKEESRLDFSSCTAQALHNKVRAFAGWPGTLACFGTEDPVTGAEESFDIKVCRTRVYDHGLAVQGMQWSPQDTLLIGCREGTTLEVLEVQLPTKKVIAVKDFRNGIRNKRLFLDVPGGQRLVAI